MMDRRSFFATLMSPLLAQFAPKLPVGKPQRLTSSLDALNSYTTEFLVQPMADSIFNTSPIFTRLNGLSEWQDNDFTGGNAISRPIWNGYDEEEDDYEA